MASGASEGSQTLDRALRLLVLLAERDVGWTVTELSAELAAARPVIYRLLTTLTDRHLAVRGPDGRVRLGLGVLALAEGVQPVLRNAAGPVLRELADAVGATAHLTLAEGATALAIMVVEPRWTAYHVAYRVGSRHPLDRGAAGRAILAVRAGVTDGLATSDGELQPGAHGIAAGWTVGGLEGSVGVVSLAPLDRVAVGDAVRAAADALTTRLLGGSPP